MAANVPRSAVIQKAKLMLANQTLKQVIQKSREESGGDAADKDKKNDGGVCGARDRFCVVCCAYLFPLLSSPLLEIHVQSVWMW